MILVNMGHHGIICLCLFILIANTDRVQGEFDLSGCIMPKIRGHCINKVGFDPRFMSIFHDQLDLDLIYSVQTLHDATCTKDITNHQRYRLFTECMYGSLATCLDPSRKALLAYPFDLVNAALYVCSRSKSIKWDCFQRVKTYAATKNAMNACIEEYMKSKVATLKALNISLSSMEGRREERCHSVMAHIECSGELAKCLKSRENVFHEYMKYLKPRVGCSAAQPSFPTQPRSIASTTIIASVVWIALPQIGLLDLNLFGP